MNKLLVLEQYILTSDFSFFPLKHEKKLENEATLAWPFVAYNTPRLVEARLSVCKWFDGWRTQKHQVHNWRSTVSTGESLQIASTTWSMWNRTGGSTSGGRKTSKRGSSPTSLQVDYPDSKKKIALQFYLPYYSFVILTDHNYTPKCILGCNDRSDKNWGTSGVKDHVGVLPPCSTALGDWSIDSRV